MKKEKHTFKVGDAPEWTVDLIKQLPHGTELECAYIPKDKDFYKGQTTRKDCDEDISFEGDRKNIYFNYNLEKRNAKILSLPDSYLNPVKPEEEFEAGEIVEVRFNDWHSNIWRKRKYVCFADNLHWCRHKDENELTSFDEIRKIKPGPDKHLKELADDVLKENQLDEIGDSVPVEIQMSTIKQMLIEMGKKVQDKIK